MKKNIILVGMPGCGKSTIGKLLAEKLDYKFCDLDEYVVQKEKMSIDEMFLRGEEYFRDKESEAVRDACNFNKTVIATGGGVITRQENIENLKKNGFIIFLDRPIDEIISDVDTESRPLLKDGTDKLYALLEDRYEMYRNCCDIEIVNDSEIEGLVERIVRLFK